MNGYKNLAIAVITLAHVDLGNVKQRGTPRKCTNKRAIESAKIFFKSAAYNFFKEIATFDFREKTYHLPNI